MAVSRIEIGRGSDNITWNVYLDSQTFVTVDRTGIQSLLKGQDRFDNAIISAAASDLLQKLWDAPPRQLLADLPGPGDDPDDPEGDPDKTIDPARFDLFHARVVPGDQLGQVNNAIDIYRPTALVGASSWLANRPKIIRPALVWSELVTMAVIWPPT